MNNFKLIIFAWFGIFSGMIYSQAPNDCANYIQICGDEDLNLDVNGPGSIITRASCGSQEHNSLWIRVTVSTSGTLGFILTPESTSIAEDYDFWVYGPNVSCQNLGNPIRCSTTNPAMSGASNNLTGMDGNATDVSEGPGDNGNSFVRWLDVQSGESFFIVIDRPIGNSAFNLQWIGSAEIENPFDGLNPPFNFINSVELCDETGNGEAEFDFSSLDANFFNGHTGFENTYYYSVEDATIGANPIIGSTLVSAGTYYMRTQGTQNGCFEIYPLEIEMGNMTINSSNFTFCDFDSSGSEVVDLSTLDITVIPNIDYTTEFYSSESDAINQLNPLNNNQDLEIGSHNFWVRAYSTSSTCFGVGEIEVNITSNILVRDENFTLCDDNFDNEVTTDLTQYIEFLVDSFNFNLVEYYPTEQDAMNGTNPISDPENYVVNGNSTVYFVFKNENCSNTAVVNFEIAVQPSLSPTEINLCNVSGSGFETIDLSNLHFETSPEEGVELTFYEEEWQAFAGMEPIDPVVTFDVGNHIYYARAVLDTEECYSIAPIIVGIQESIEVERGEYTFCDPENDGIEVVDLSSFVGDIAISDNYTEVRYYHTLEDAQSLENEISEFTNYEVTDDTTIYYRFNNESCLDITSILFHVNTQPRISNVSESICAPEDQQSLPFNLQTDLTYEVSPENMDYQLYFYNTQQDAENGVNEISSEVTLTPGDNIYFTKIKLGSNECVDIAEINIVLELPILTNEENVFEYCDVDYDGILIIDLTSLNDQILITNNATGQAFYRTRTDAEMGTNPIENFTEYSIENSATIFYKYYNRACETIVPVFIEVLEKPNLGEDETIYFCPEEAPVQLSVNPNFLVYEWSNDPNVHTPNIEVSEPGTYTVIAQNELNCEDSKTFTLEYLEFPFITQINIGDSSINLSGSGAAPLYYSIDDGENWLSTTEFNDLPAGLYTVKIRREEGCISEGIEVVVVSINNALTPNGDGINDTWNIPYLGVYENAEVNIYDRYGKAVLKQVVKQGNFEWNGKLLGSAMPSTTYWYVINIPGNGIIQPQQFKGWILLKNYKNY